MAQISYRANLSSAIFPLAVSQAGPTVIVPGPDNNYDRRVDPEGEQKDAGIPQAVYLENVIPTATGYQSVGKFIPTPLTAPAAGLIINQFPAIKPSQNDEVYMVTLVFSPGPDTYLASIAGTGNWNAPTFVGIAADPTQTPLITYAIVRGTCYVLIRELGGAHLYSAEILVDSTLQLTNVSGSVTGGVLTDAAVICGSFNYLTVINSSGKVNWSSTTDPLDFVISLVSGAGEATPNGLYGGLTNAYATQFGFYMFSRAGVTTAQYTGNSRYPWKFEIVTDTNVVESVATQDPNSYRVLSYDAAYNFYLLEGNSARPVAPELGAYLRSNRKGYKYNYTSHSLETIAPEANVTTKVYCFYDRYLCVSADAEFDGGKIYYNTIILYDMRLSRYGRLRHRHTTLVVNQDTLNAQLTFASIDSFTGAICVFNLTGFPNNTVGWDFSDSVAILGKFKYVRGRRIELQDVTLSGQFNAVNCVLLPGSNSQIFASAVTPTIASDHETYKSYNCRIEGDSVSVAVEGQFVLDALELTFSLGGAR